MGMLSVRAAPLWYPPSPPPYKYSVGLVVTVNQPSTGDPVTGLRDTDFAVFVSGGPDPPNGSPMRSIRHTVSQFVEHPPGDAHGAYTLGLDAKPDWGLVAIFIIDVNGGADRGRAVTMIRF